MFVDSHCHLDKIKRTQREGIEPVLAAARAQQVDHMLCVGVSVDDFTAMEAAVGKRTEVSFSCGYHPLYLAKQTIDLAALTVICERTDVVAVGETGLDYYYDQKHHHKQQESFAGHIELANQVNKPLIIHTRDARDDTIALLREGRADQCRGVLHCFTEDLAMAKRAIDLGFYISISGIATFANATALRDVVRALPLDSLLIETDSPWLAPVPHRGKENEPQYVPEVAATIASLHGVSIERVAEQTKQNFIDLFYRHHTELPASLLASSL